MKIPHAVAVLVTVAIATACRGDAGRASRPLPPPTAEACVVLDRQVAARTAADSDVVGLDRPGIDGRLRGWEDDDRQLAGVDQPGRGFYEPRAELTARARPLVVDRWGERDGTALHERAYRDGRFDVVEQALAEAGRGDDAQEWARLRTNRSWSFFRLATRCHPTSVVPAEKLSELSGNDGPPLPLLALDVSVGGRLTRVEASGLKTFGAKSLRLHFPMMSPDRTTVVAQTVTGPDQAQHVRTLSSATAALQRDLGGEAECGGWLADGTLVLARADGVRHIFEAVGRPNPRLPLVGGDCPVPGFSTDEVLLTQGEREREDAWVAAERIADGTVTRRFQRTGCTVTSPAVNPSRNLAVFAAACANPLDSGLWTAPPSGDLTHILTCVCGVPAFSPDGRWITYTIGPVEGGGGFDNRLGFTRPDGSGAFHLRDGRLSFPMWAGT
jgi:hypothetical protein